MLAIARVLPARVLARLFVQGAPGDGLATVIFSSGSTGVPKGVMLTHRNIISNIDSVNQAFRLTRQDVMLGVLPFFHSFGFTGTLWFPILTGFGVVYHPNPMDAKTIGELAQRYRATLIISTPTFCSSYIRKCQPSSSPASVTQSSAPKNCASRSPAPSRKSSALNCSKGTAAPRWRRLSA